MKLYHLASGPLKVNTYFLVNEKTQECVIIDSGENYKKIQQTIKENGFNLKALKSRPTKELIWNYYFYAEGEGNIDSEHGKNMLKELSKCCSNLKILGSFEKEIKV